MRRALTLSALIKRINREFAHDGLRLKITRGERWRHDPGDYCILNVINNWIDYKHVLPETGREIGVLARYETLLE